VKQYQGSVMVYISNNVIEITKPEEDLTHILINIIKKDQGTRN